MLCRKAFSYLQLVIAFAAIATLQVTAQGSLDVPVLMTTGTFRERCDHAQTIAIAQIASFGSLNLMDGGHYLDPVKVNLSVSAVLKGSCPHSIIATFDQLSAEYFMVRRLLVTGDYIVCFLGSDSLQPDILYGKNWGSLIPLGSHAPDLAYIQGASDATTCVIRALLDAMKYPNMRHVLALAIRYDNNAELPMGLFPYLNDPDPLVKESALWSMASCQQVAAIPMIADRVHELALEGKPLALSRSLFAYKSSTASSELCRLLFRPEAELRGAAAADLSQIQDPHTIPFLILGLHDPFTQFACAIALRGMCPELRKQLNHRMTDKDASAEIAPALSWWSDELNGLHPPTSRVDCPPFPADRPLPVNVDELGTLLFQTDAALRVKACQKLVARPCSLAMLPYLMIAIEDPNADVAWSACQAIADYEAQTQKAIPNLKEQIAAAPHNQLPSPALKDAIYDWWISRFRSGLYPYAPEIF